MDATTGGIHQRGVGAEAGETDRRMFRAPDRGASPGRFGGEKREGLRAVGDRVGFDCKREGVI